MTKQIDSSLRGSRLATSLRMDAIIINLNVMKKLLLIEDDRGISDSLTLYLEQSGFSLCKCEDGSEAMDMFAQCKPQLVILDLNLP